MPAARRRSRDLGRPKRINEEMPEAVRLPSLGRWFRDDRFVPHVGRSGGLVDFLLAAVGRNGQCRLHWVVCCRTAFDVNQRYGDDFENKYMRKFRALAACILMSQHRQQSLTGAMAPGSHDSSTTVSGSIGAAPSLLATTLSRWPFHSVRGRLEINDCDVVLLPKVGRQA